MNGQRLDPHHTASQWAEVSKHLDAALRAWAEVSPDSVGPIEELAQDARYNVLDWTHQAQGMSRHEAWRAVEAEYGRLRVAARHINYDPDESEGGNAWDE